MPIEIRELHIKVTVTNPSGEPQSATRPPQTSQNGRPAADREKLVAECVEKVLEILETKNER